jgi:hypothetical protein
VQTLDGDALAWLYVLDAYEGGLPSGQRLTILVDSALKAGAPADYVDWLRARPSNPPNDQLSPGGATPRTPRCPPGAGLIAKTAILSGPPPANQSCGSADQSRGRLRTKAAGDCGNRRGLGGCGAVRPGR